MELLPKAHNALIGHKYFAGIDEAGRGCLAGPVVAAAVILPDNFCLPGLGDSKTLSEKKRNSLANAIKMQATSYAYGIRGPRTIDRVNILQATFMAMAQAAGRLQPVPELLYIDGNMTIPGLYLAENWLSNAPLQKAIIKGDALMPVISAASILAKTFRDHLMAKIHKKWPEYGFASHKGYGSKQHIQALRTFGPCPIHRLTFSKVRQGYEMSLFSVPSEKGK